LSGADQSTLESAKLSTEEEIKLAGTAAERLKEILTFTKQPGISNIS